MRLSAAPDACAESFTQARTQLKFPASTCVLDLTQKKACSKIDQLLAVPVLATPSTKVVWSKWWNKDGVDHKKEAEQTAKEEAERKAKENAPCVQSLQVFSKGCCDGTDA